MQKQQAIELAYGAAAIAHGLYQPEADADAAPWIEFDDAVRLFDYLAGHPDYGAEVLYRQLSEWDRSAALLWHAVPASTRAAVHIFRAVATSARELIEPEPAPPAAEPGPGEAERRVEGIGELADGIGARIDGAGAPKKAPKKAAKAPAAKKAAKS